MLSFSFAFSILCTTVVQFIHIWRLFKKKQFKFSNSDRGEIYQIKSQLVDIPRFFISICNLCVLIFNLFGYYEKVCYYDTTYLSGLLC